MKTYLLQPLKLQLRASYKFYLVNYLVLIILFVLSKVLDIFFILEIGLILEILFTLTMGLLNNMVNANTYYALKHDRKPFILSSIIIDVINGLIISLLFIIPMMLFKDNSANFNVLGLVCVLVIMILAFSVGSTYAIYLSNKKIVNIIVVMVLLALAIIFGAMLFNYLEIITGAILNIRENGVDNNFSKRLLEIILIGVPSIVLLNIVNAIKYMHK